MAKNLKSVQPSLTNYIGDQKIKSVRTAKRTTILGHPVVEVTFETGNVTEFPEKVFKKISTIEPCDLNLLRDKTIEPVAQDIMMLLTDSEVKICDLDSLFQLIQFSFNKSFEKVDEVLWGNTARERTLYQADKIIKDAEKRKVSPDTGGDKPNKTNKV